MNTKSDTWVSLVTVLYLVLAIFGLSDYLLFSSAGFLLGITGLVFMLPQLKKKPGTARFAFVSLSLAIFYLFIPAKTILFGAVCAGIICLVESRWGRVDLLFMLSIVYISPLFDYMANVFSFPIRLAVSATAANILSLSGNAVKAEGNSIAFDNTEFTVDPGCMGLNMLTASLACTVILIAIFQKKSSKKISGLLVTMLMIATLLLNIISNQVRITILVFFKVLPESNLHYGIGMACFLLYTIIPAAWTIRFITRRYGCEIHTSLTSISLPKMGLILNTMLPVMIAVAMIFCDSRNPETLVTSKNAFAVPGYTRELLPGNIVKFQNTHALIYIKPIIGFYATDHHPMICWTGSGYLFTKVARAQMGKSDVYTGILEKSNQKLYTAWWYDDGSHATISQLDWRWGAFSESRNYSLINITALTQKKLEEAVEQFSASRSILHKY